MTKLRLSNHKLMIEKGRHQGLEKEERICPFCTSVEDEIHFLTECEVFTPLRRDLLTQAQNISKSPQMRHLQGKDLFKFLLQREDLAKLVSKYLTRSMELREFLFDNHRQPA